MVWQGDSLHLPFLAFVSGIKRDSSGRVKYYSISESFPAAGDGLSADRSVMAYLFKSAGRYEPISGTDLAAERGKSVPVQWETAGERIGKISAGEMMLGFLLNYKENINSVVRQLTVRRTSHIINRKCDLRYYGKKGIN